MYNILYIPYKVVYTYDNNFVINNNLCSVFKVIREVSHCNSVNGV